MPSRWARTSDKRGFVNVVPSGKSTVGTVWLPPFTLMTNSAAPGVSSMLISVYAMPSSVSCRLSVRQLTKHLQGLKHA